MGNSYDTSISLIDNEKRMKKKYYILGSILLILIISYFVDQEFFMKERVLRHKLWDYESGERIRGDFIDTKYITFNKNMMIFDYGRRRKDTLILKYQYFSTMKVMDTKTKKTCKYSMKGANWTNYIPFLGKNRNSANKRR